MILPCTCNHADQDRFHGKGRRVYNEGKTLARCSVCSKTVTLSSQQIKDKSTKKGNK